MDARNGIEFDFANSGSARAARQNTNARHFGLRRERYKS